MPRIEIIPLLAYAQRKAKETTREVKISRRLYGDEWVVDGQGVVTPDLVVQPCGRIVVGTVIGRRVMV
jgi:hypothetical protein